MAFSLTLFSGLPFWHFPYPIDVIMLLPRLCQSQDSFATDIPKEWKFRKSDRSEDFHEPSQYFLVPGQSEIPEVQMP
jgi:hypothetical protein